MIQRLIIAAGGIFALLCCISCEKSAPPVADSAPATQPRRITVASLSPAATDLIVGMGLADRLIAVSNYEPPRAETDKLPRVGDYRTADWERIGRLKPTLIITQYRDDKMPEGFRERCASLGISIFNRKIDSLDDAFNTIAELGAVLGEPEKAAAAQERWRQRMSALAARVGDRPRPRTLLVVGESGLSVAGPGTFLDNLLTAAGGHNALTGGPDYSTIDREKLSAIDPEVIIQLLPGASPQQIEQADAFWRSMPQLAAVKSGRVYKITDPDVLLPGFNCPRTAERFAEILHARAPASSRAFLEPRRHGGHEEEVKLLPTAVRRRGDMADERVFVSFVPSWFTSSVATLEQSA